MASLRKAVGMSRAELARRLGVDPTTVWRWETSGSRPESPEVPEKLAALFRIDHDEVLAAAGLKTAVATPVEPSVERDEEAEAIMRSSLPIAIKKDLLQVLAEERERDKQRRMEHMLRLIQAERRRAG